MCNLNLKEAQSRKPKEKRPTEVREKQSVSPTREVEEKRSEGHVQEACGAMRQSKPRNVF